MNQRNQDYLNRLSKYNQQKSELKNKQKHLPTLRFVSFLIAALLFYQFLTTYQNIYLVVTIALLITLIVLSYFDLILKNKILKTDQFIKINENELEALKHNFSMFDGGQEFINPEHPYSNDLDLFGKNSLFQYFNRTATIFGKKKLANYFINTIDYKDRINERQNAVLELSENIDFRQKLQTIFFDQNPSENDFTELNNWLNTKSEIPQNKYIKTLIYSYISITIFCILLYFIGLIPYQIPLILFLSQLFAVSMFLRFFTKTQSAVNAKFKIISKYAQCLQLIENTEFKSSLLSELNNSLNHENQSKPSEIIGKLAKIINWMDSNLNIAVATILNGTFLFSILLTYQAEDWKRNYSNLIIKWLEIIAEFDALSSIGNYAFNNPEYIYPRVETENFTIEALSIGHPLIPKKDCITNDFSIHGWNQMTIVTGANMAGKSTFLRTIGTNLTLGIIGAPVFANKFTFTPIEIYSSIRTSDSLAKNESYFYAELKRLKAIITELEKGIPKFILLDEILKGTNSQDKQSGSIELIKHLLQYNFVGIFATHDQALGDLINSYPNNVQNACFEISFNNDQMIIDYKIREGVCKNLNATYLMKKMGIIKS